MKDLASTGHGALEVEPGRIGAADLFRAHGPFVAGFLVRLGAARVDVDDLTQEVFLVAHRRGGYAPGAARPTTWLAEIAIRVLSTHRRTKRRRPEQPAGESLDTTHDGGAAPDEHAASRNALARVQQCLDGLDEEHRAVFVLFELEGEPCPAIAAALGLPVGTVYSRLHHARQRFLEAWAARGGGR